MPNISSWKFSINNGKPRLPPTDLPEIHKKKDIPAYIRFLKLSLVDKMGD